MKMLVVSNGRQERLFKSIDNTTPSYTFQNSQGLLFSTEFAQPALTIMEHAQYQHLRSQGIIAEDAMFAGHSLGEYTALSTIGQIMSFSDVLSVVFYRGLTMQVAVERDSKGRSDYAMVAVNPSRVGKAMTQENLRSLVQLIQSEANSFLEVVNYNVETQQYVCAGTIASLDCLTQVTNHLSINAKDLSSQPNLRKLISKITSTSTKTSTLTRGHATIPLTGIDVPFHSSALLPKMPAFRELLLSHIPVEAIDPQKLIGRYVSNVTGKVFGVSREDFTDAWKRTGSVVLEKVLGEWDLECQA